MHHVLDLEASDSSKGHVRSTEFIYIAMYQSPDSQDLATVAKIDAR